MALPLSHPGTEMQPAAPYCKLCFSSHRYTSINFTWCCCTGMLFWNHNICEWKFKCINLIQQFESIKEWCVTFERQKINTCQHQRNSQLTLVMTGVTKCFLTLFRPLTIKPKHETHTCTIKNFLPRIAQAFISQFLEKLINHPVCIFLHKSMKFRCI